MGMLFLLLALPSLTGAQTAFGRILVFRTSLSDPGNTFELTGLQSTPPYDALDPLLVPGAPYAKGGNHGRMTPRGLHTRACFGACGEFLLLPSRNPARTFLPA